MGLLVASVLEDHSSKCSTSYLQQLKQDLLSHEGAWWVSCVREGAKQEKGDSNESYCCDIWVTVCSTSLSSRPVAIAYLIAVRTALMSGFQFRGSDGAFPPR
jgi:hypothetical protein